jgi:hypothetical protein
MTLATLLIIIAIILFILAALGVNSGKVNLIALGLAFWALSTIAPGMSIG